MMLSALRFVTVASLIAFTACADDDNGNNNNNGDFPPSGAQFVIGVIGDSGDTSDLMDGQTGAGEVADLVKSWSPQAILTLGDNDYTDGMFEGTNTGLELGIGQYYADYIGNYRGSYGAGSTDNRFFPVPGDHDYGDDCTNPRLADYLDYFTLPMGEGDETYYDVRQGPVHIFAIDSVIDCHQDSGAKIEAQKAWLQRTALASDAPFKIVIAHHPPYSSGERHGSAEYMRWDYAAWGIQLVMSGDDHIYERGETGGVTYLVNGLGGVEQHPIGSAIPESITRYSDEFGAIGIAVFNNRLDVRFITVSGATIDSFTIMGEGVDMDAGVADIGSTADGGADAGSPVDMGTPLDMGTPVDMGAPDAGGSGWTQFPVSDTWQWQLQGTLNTSYNVDVYDIDLFDTDPSVISALQNQGRKVVCYFSAGSWENFRDDANQFTPSDYGNTLGGFPDERWLDIRSANVRSIMRARLDVAVQKGCDAVEPDNVDGYTNNPGFPLTAADQLDYNRFLATEAHNRNLAVGLKNDLDQVAELVNDFDFAVNEQCSEFDECGVLAPFTNANKAVFRAEYDQRYVDNAGARNTLCTEARALNHRTLILSDELDDSLRLTCD